MSFGYCIATLLEFAGVHYFTKVGSGEERPIEETEWEECEDELTEKDSILCGPQTIHSEEATTPQRVSILCPIYNVSIGLSSTSKSFINQLAYKLYINYLFFIFKLSGSWGI